MKEQSEENKKSCKKLEKKGKRRVEEKKGDIW